MTFTFQLYIYFYGYSTNIEKVYRSSINSWNYRKMYNKMTESFPRKHKGSERVKAASTYKLYG